MGMLTGFIYCMVAFLHVVYGAFDDTTSRNNYYLAAVAASAPDPNPCAKVAYPNISPVKSYVVDCDIEKRGGDYANITCLAWVGVDTVGKRIVVAFRGTQSDTKQLDEEIDMTLNYPPVVMGELGSVHPYFSGAFNELWTNMSEDMTNILNDPTYNDFTITSVGHSLGGALAAIFAGYVSKEFSIPMAQLELYTYGQPRTFDLSFATYIKNNIGTKYRVTHREDPVPSSIQANVTVNGNKYYYKHWYDEIYYNNDMSPGSTWVDCTNLNDSTCSERIPLFGGNAADHLTYYGVELDYLVKHQCAYPPASVCAYSWVLLNVTTKLCLKPSGLKMGFKEAQAACQSYNPQGNLVSIHDAFMNSALIPKAKEYINCLDNYWIGGISAFDYTSWNWTDGTTWNYHNWGSGYPKDSFLRCAKIMVKDSTWQDSDCAEGIDADQYKACSICAYPYTATYNYKIDQRSP